MPPSPGRDGRFVIAPALGEAIAAGAPVVALETTAIAHGFPGPQNLDVARALDRSVRAAGALPAFIGLIEGRVIVGLDDRQIARLAGGNAMKVSRADLAFAVTTGRDGATTVAATMICAARAGLSVFATGGIGGVHRGVERTLDVSADLEELGRTPIAVVCAGAKSILDLPRTMEYLETRGVPVVGYRTDVLPAFHVRDSGIALAHRIDDVPGLARLIAVQRGLGLMSGIVITNPVPTRHALAGPPMEAAIEAAIEAAARSGVGGKALTPFLLDRLAEFTGGDTLKANAALLESNASLAGQVAVALAALA